MCFLLFKKKHRVQRLRDITLQQLSNVARNNQGLHWPLMAAVMRRRGATTILRNHPPCQLTPPQPCELCLNRLKFSNRVVGSPRR